MGTPKVKLGGRSAVQASPAGKSPEPIPTTASKDQKKEHYSLGVREEKGDVHRAATKAACAQFEPTQDRVSSTTGGGEGKSGQVLSMNRAQEGVSCELGNAGRVWKGGGVGKFPRGGDFSPRKT